jgi:hypothetical protein
MLANKASNLIHDCRRERAQSWASSSLAQNPCHGDIFHIQHQAKELVSFLSRRAEGATSSAKTGAGNAQSETQGRGHTLSTKLTQARRVALEAVQLANDVKILIQWLNHDILALAGPHWRSDKNCLILSSPN